MLSAVIAPVEPEPLTGREPLHAPEASHELAFDEVHVSVEATPSATVVGLALNEMSGAGTAPTATSTEALATPPGPTQEREKLATPSIGPTGSVPETALEPDQAPDALQLVAPVELQLKTAESLLVGDAVRETVGVGGAGPSPDEP
ncbi:MAG: hypothetical protein WAU39_18405 [Polyangiales bacterium]